MRSRYIAFLITIISASLLILNAKSVQAQLLAFPTAEGAGKFVTGGRGTAATAPKIFEVTSLVDNATAASTPGTLRYACTNNSPSAPNRIIVFRVSGTIHLYTTLSLSRANTTIAGQTAPGGGITIADYPVYLGANNIMVRYIRFRLGDKNQAATLGNDDAFGDNGGAKQKIIIDHCTMSWSNDEVCSIYEGDSTSIQWCMMSEPLDSSYHDEGSGVQNHAYGGIQGGKHASIHHNIYAHCKGRMPRFSGIRNGVADTTDFRNNVIYNWSDYNTNGGEGGTYNVVNNYYKYGPNTASVSSSGVNRRNMLINPGKQSSPAIPFGRYFLEGNYCFNSSTVTNRNWLGASFASGTFADSVASKMTVPFRCVDINTQTALNAYNSVLEKAGTTLPYRDTLDQRIVRDVINRTGNLINCQGGYPRGTAYATTQNAWPFLPTGFTPTDTDHDGMPDIWETQRGLNPSSTADMNTYISTTGYNNVETYLNGDTLTAPGIVNTCITAKGFTSNTSNNWLHARDTAFGAYNLSTYLVSTDTNNLVASVYDAGNFGSFNVSYYTSSINRTDANGKPYLKRNITIAPQNAGSITTPITVRFYLTKKEYDDLKAADNTILTLADLRVVKSADVTCMTTIPSNTSFMVPTASGIFGSYKLGYYLEFVTSSFGTFFVTGKNSLLPLKLKSFSAILTNDKVQTKWVTENEINTLDFAIEKSADAFHFITAGKVTAKNTSGVNSYSFLDISPFTGRSFYRLKMTDRDGTFQFSEMVTINRKENNVLVISPNPANNEITVTHPVASGNATIRIFSSIGSEVLKLVLKGGSRVNNCNIETLAPGNYILEYRDGSISTKTTFSKLLD